MSRPRYPAIRLRVDSDNPLVWVSEVRLALRRSGVERDEIRRFSARALGAGADDEAIRQVCSDWAAIEIN